MATAFNAQDVTTTETDLFDARPAGADVAGGPCATFDVGNQSDAGTLLVNIPGLHAATEWFPIGPGASKLFRSGDQGITRVRAKASTGTVTAGGGVVAKL